MVSVPEGSHLVSEAGRLVNRKVTDTPSRTGLSLASPTVAVTAAVDVPSAGKSVGLEET